MRINYLILPKRALYSFTSGCLSSTALNEPYLLKYKTAKIMKNNSKCWSSAVFQINKGMQ